MAEEFKDIIVGLEQRIKNYRTRLKDVEKKREKLSDQVETIQKYLEVAETLYRVEVDKAKLASLSTQITTEDVANNSPAISGSDAEDQARDILLGRSRFSRLNIPDATYKILSETRKPMHAKDLYQRLLEGGIHIRGKTPVTSIATAVKRDKRFRKVLPNTFELVEDKNVGT
ncbi:MAG: hypothetical protein CMH81_07175 [Nitrospiraceae bacterium]|nr:hypothetical protein [Nitrospiraceae bacterium]|tara:strand:+ start:150 stop:665 length:516 start_codon:yes stop_codon:yes gene_type:complete